MMETKIKICGIFRPCDAEYVSAAVPDYAGFVFYEKSRRNITPERAWELRRAMPPAIITAGVFVEARKDWIAEIYQENIISVIQLHGSEDDGYIAGLRELLPDAVIWKAFKIRSERDLESAASCTADTVLLDNGCGTGQPFDWSLIKGFPRPYILAGGITPETIPDAVSRFHPYAVDLSSGVESHGLKNRRKIFAAVAAARTSRAGEATSR